MTHMTLTKLSHKFLFLLDRWQFKQRKLDSQVQGLPKRVLPRLLECSRQVEAEVVGNSNNKIHQT